MATATLTFMPKRYRRWWAARVREHLRVMAAQPGTLTCGRCRAFSDGFCTHPDRELDDDDVLEARNAGQPGCAFFCKEVVL